MKSLNANVRDADLSSTDKHIFPWKWNLSDLKSVPKNGRTVFTCFSCGGGSSMGYKLAGYTVLGNCEIDPKMMEVYKTNHHPKYSYLMDIRDFVKLPDSEIPDELKHLDILDGSPPCSVFSTAGSREDGWNTEKVFREGQAAQRLDDLFFYFIEAARKLQPKVIVAENVKGLLLGNAKGYVNEIIKAFDLAGYKVQIFLLNASRMGVPQKRERVFFIAHRKDLDYPKIKMEFNEKPILFGEVRSEKGKQFQKNGVYSELLKYRKKTDKSIADITKRIRGKESGYNNTIWHDDDVGYTVVSSGCHFRMCDGLWLSDDDYKNCQTFPQDYNFLDQSVQYICGMSVPPVMMAQVARQIWRQWLND